MDTFLVFYGNMIRYVPSLVDLTSNFFVPCTKEKVYIMIYSGWRVKATLKPETNKIKWRVVLSVFEGFGGLS